MREIGDSHIIEMSIGSVIDGLVEGVRANANASPTEIVFTDVDGVEGIVPGLLAHGQDVSFADRIVV